MKANGDKRPPRWPVVVLAVLTAWIALTSARIEWANHAAGSVLPMASVQSGESKKWRATSDQVIERQFRTDIALARGELDMDTESLAAMQLAPSERADLGRELAEGRAWNRLRDLVGTVGCLQYALVPLNAALGVCVLVAAKSRGTRIAAGITLVVTVAAGGLTLYRGYFTSLGI